MSKSIVIHNIDKKIMGEIGAVLGGSYSWTEHHEVEYPHLYALLTMIGSDNNMQMLDEPLWNNVRGIKVCEGRDPTERLERTLRRLETLAARFNEEQKAVVAAGEYDEALALMSFHLPPKEAPLLQEFLDAAFGEGEVSIRDCFYQK